MSQTSAPAGFDPLSDLFLAQLERPEELRAVNLRTLTPFQRALLVIDGTVTRFLEAYTLEPVEVVRLAQANRELAEENPWLEAAPGARVAVRHVLIRGEHSRAFYVYAVSSIHLERLPEVLREAVEAGEEGLGRLLVSAALETRREVLWYGLESPRELPPEVRRETRGPFLSRTYRILAGGRPLMIINERFPLMEEELPSHH